MIENAEVAKYVSRTFLHINDQLDESIGTIVRMLLLKSLRPISAELDTSSMKFLRSCLDPL